jgi:spoIIIJ-associated protein
MYDARNERHEFVGDNREQAARKAADFFGVGVEELKIGEFPEGEVYGLGGRSVIVASLRDHKMSAPGRSEGRGAGREEGRRSERRGRSDRGGGERREASESFGERERSRTADQPDEPKEPSIGTVAGEIGEIGEFVLGVLERLDLGPFEVSESAEGNLLVFEVKGSAIRKLASGEGRAMDALQLLANQAAKRREGNSTRVVIDAEGNAEAREDFLTRVASRAAGRARQTGRAVALDAMNGRDRRAIHLALRDEADVATMSVGEGRYRQVVIVPEGAPEYENARRESELARSQRDR